MELSEIVSFLDEYLNISAFREASNGLQVEGCREVEKVAFAVDASLDAFLLAVEAGADMLVTHHGIIWGSISSVKGIIQQRLRFLLENELSLYTAHLPLDAHPEIGNNAMILRSVGVEPEEPFGHHGSEAIGYAGKAEKEFDEILEVLEEKFGETGYLKFGDDVVRKVAAVSGRGAFSLPEAVEKGVDLLITGEAEHSAYHIAKEGNISVIFLGHYRSETPGIKALMMVVADKLGLEVEFIEVPTGL